MRRAKTEKAQIHPPAQVAAAEYPTEIAISPAEAAKRCGIGRTFLYSALTSGTLKSVKIGSRRLITLQAIHDWLGAHERRPALKEAKRA